MQKTLRAFSVFLVMLAFMAAATAVPAQSRSGLPDFTQLVEDNANAVVNISTTSKVNRGVSPFGDGQMEQLPEFFRDFFEDRFRGNPMPRGEQEKQSMGSGFIVSADGYILTNNHVVEGADEIIVRLNDRRELEAEVVGSDARSDIAVLKVEGEDLPAAKIGNSSDLEVGEWVFAIGSPFGFDYTVTSGIVSAKGRSLPRDNYIPFIQTDVAINPGNSGGPLFNMDGEVIGVNSQIYTRSGGFMGVSFAIPMDVAMDVFEQLKKTGSVTRGWLGVMIQEVNRDLAETFGLERPYGALVADVVPDSPAAEAGLQSGDVILEFNGEEITRSSDLPPKVGQADVGSEAELTVMRDKERQTVTFEVAKLPEDDQQVAQQQPETDTGNRLGLRVKDLPEQLAREWELDGGVLVTEVGRGPARQAGIRRNDVIRKIGNQGVTSVSEFQEVVDSIPTGQPVAVTLIRQGTPRIVAIRVPE
ncbi:serine protease Do [Halospina denitrificans]|uniref:Probable periplasmic serine endoprotease DegP-like n=1 Tax=Halospina denitrificans TaxID=332522 RepID=A0A4R7JN15_9GAMM|nr:serine protease Do [Halospina denitrificans]